jgi:D-alanyl-lipoteichoic acid acyltransferase DltB (MBOAT superfamily)
VLISSYVFYGWWDWRFLSLIVLSTIVDFYIGKTIYETKSRKKRKNLLTLSLVFNLGVLGFFKYFNFFVDSFIEAFDLLGLYLDPWTLSIVLPVGISFYTFQTLSYSIDIYRRQIKPCGDFIAFAAFVSFFPQLVAGPIERASNLVPQFLKKRHFSLDQAISGLTLIWTLAIWFRDSIDVL